MYLADEGLRTIVAELLSEEGWEVYDVETWQGADAVMRAARPGVFVVDPGLAVDELDTFLTSIQRMHARPGVLILSDLASAEAIADHHRALFLKEPFELDDLARAVEHARRSVHRRLQSFG